MRQEEQSRRQMATITAMSLIVVCVSACGRIERPQQHQMESVPASTASTGNAQLSGQWQGSLTDPDGRRHPMTLKLKVEGTVVSGTFAGAPPDGSEIPISNGKLAGDHLTFQLQTRSPTGEPFALKFDGKVSGNRIAGLHGPQGEGFPWEATKQ